MNQILLYKQDFIDDTTVRLTGRRLLHINTVHKAGKNDFLKIGLLNGNQGRGEVIAINEHEVVLKTILDSPPPGPLPLTLVIALPRPKMLKRVLQYSAALGVKKIFLIRTWRVEKSYFQSPWLHEDNIREQLILGLEQARDTMLPEVTIKKLFKPFVEDELPGICNNCRAYVAHPDAARMLERNHNNEHLVLAIGPEGGFVPYEIELLQRQGFVPVTTGERILRVDTVVPYIIGRLF